MMRISRFACLGLLIAVGINTQAAEAPPVPATTATATTPPVTPPPPEINENEVVRISMARGGDFPWVGLTPAKPVTPPPPPKPADAQPAAGPAGFGGTDVVILALGPLSRNNVEVFGADGVKAIKEVITLQKSVEIEQPSAKSALRGENIKVTRDVASGNMDKLEASGNVEMVSPDRTMKGDNLVFESAVSPKGDTLKNLAVVTGDMAKGQRAKIWNGDDWIQAYRFTIDMYRNTFKAQNTIKAQITMAAPPAPATPGTPGAPAAPATPAPAAPAPAAGGGLISGFSLTSGGTMIVTCDGEMFYEQNAYTIKLKTNITITHPSMTMEADEMTMVMKEDPPAPATPPPPAGAPANPAAPAASTGIFGGGGLKTVLGKGRIVIKTFDPLTKREDRIIHCDVFYWDLEKERLSMEMKDSSKESTEMVKIYMRDPLITTGELMANGVVMAKGKITLDTKDGTAKDTPFSLRQFKGPIPNLRPVRGDKKTPAASTATTPTGTAP